MGRSKAHGFHVVADRQYEKELLRGYTFGSIKRSFETLLVQYEAPVNSIREDALDSMLGLFCDAEVAALQGLQLAVEEKGAEILKRVCGALSQRAGNSRAKSTDDILSLSTYERRRGADLIHSLMLAVPPSAIRKLVPADFDSGVHKVLLQTLIDSPETASACLGALQALLLLHPQQRWAFMRSDGTFKLCTLLGESVLPEEAHLRGTELLCTLAWQLRHEDEGEFEATLLDAAKEIHLNACSVLSHFASHATLSEYALAQTTAQLRSLV